MENLEIRATSKISEGQEISISYTPLMKNFKERQKLCNEFGFVCSCEICQDEELNNDDETYEQFQNLKTEAENTYASCIQDKNLSADQRFDRIQKAIFCRTKMYTLAKGKKAPKMFILDEILVDAFFDAVNGYTFAKMLIFTLGKKDFFDTWKMEYFKQECDKLSKVGHQIAKMCYGQEHDETIKWKERNQNLENWVRIWFQNSGREIPTFLRGYVC